MQSERGVETEPKTKPPNCNTRHSEDRPAPSRRIARTRPRGHGAAATRRPKMRQEWGPNSTARWSAATKSTKGRLTERKRDRGRGPEEESGRASERYHLSPRRQCRIECAARDDTKTGGAHTPSSQRVPSHQERRAAQSIRRRRSASDDQAGLIERERESANTSEQRERATDRAKRGARRADTWRGLTPSPEPR